LINQIAPSVEMQRLETIHQAYLSELQDTIEFYVSEMATLRRIKETSTDQDVRDEITGIIQDELTTISHYRRELS
jgi:hypothetical protein